MKSLIPVFGILAWTALMGAVPARAGVGAGGGGDVATERRIDDIRSDIYKWISNGGAAGLKLPRPLDAKTYGDLMLPLLEPHAVVIGAVTIQQETETSDPELKVWVGGQPKTCRGFISEKDRLPHILCSLERFAATPESDQYELIHHEFAGLAGVEKNVGASSDYSVSRQLTGFLEEQTTLKLVVKKRESPRVECGKAGCRPWRLAGSYSLASNSQYCSPELEIRVGGGSTGDEILDIYSSRDPGASSYGTLPIEISNTQVEQIQYQGSDDIDEQTSLIHREQRIEFKPDRLSLVSKITKTVTSPWYRNLFEPSYTWYSRIDLIPTPKGRLQYVRYLWDVNLNGSGKAGYHVEKNCLYKMKR